MKKSTFAAVLAGIIGACAGGGALAGWKLDRLDKDEEVKDDVQEEKSEEKADEEVKGEEAPNDTEDESEEK